jgi:hypothetical protein
MVSQRAYYAASDEVRGAFGFERISLGEVTWRTVRERAYPCRAGLGARRRMIAGAGPHPAPACNCLNQYVFGLGEVAVASRRGPW